MSATYAAGVVVPSSGLEWRQWCRHMVEELGLCSQEANVLRLLTDRASATGRVRLGVPLIARQLVLSESQAYRWLGALAKRGLVRTRQQGPGRVAIRELVAVREPAQLSLFDAPIQDTAPVVVEAPVAPWAAHAAPCPRMDASLPSHQPEAAVDGQLTTEEGTRAARATADQPVSELAARALQARLPEVLEILDAAPGLTIEPLAVDSALAGYPESAGHDHLQAAHIVASWAAEAGGVRVGAANRLLMAALRKQSTPAAPAGAGGGRGHAARRRRAAPVMSPAMVEQTERETATMRRLMADLGFGRGA